MSTSTSGAPARPAYVVPSQDDTPANTAAAKSNNIDINDPYGFDDVKDSGQTGFLWAGGVNPATAGGQDTPQKNLRMGGGDSYNNGTAQSNNYTDAKSWGTQFMNMYSTDRGEFDALRAGLAQGGYYGATAVATITGRAAGTWDAEAMKTAMTDWLKYAHTVDKPQDFEDWLTGRSADGTDVNNAANAGGGSGGNGTQVTLTDPAALRKQVNSAAQQALGHSLTASQMQAFVDSFHSQESSSQTANQQSTAAGTDATVTNPDANAQSLEFAEKADPTGFAQNQTAAYANIFAGMFLPSASAPATQTPLAGN